MNTTSEVSIPDRLKQVFSPRKAPLWIVVAFVLYNLLGFFVVPWVAKDQVPKQIESNLGLTAKIGEIKFNPWSLTLLATDFEIDDPDGKPLAGFTELFVNLQVSSIFNWAVTLAELRIVEPRGHFIRYDFTDTNVSRALAAIPVSEVPAEEPEPADDSAGLFRIIIHNLDIQNGLVDLEDNLPKTPFITEFGPVDINVNNLSTLPEQSGKQKVSIVTENGAAIEWSGSLQIGPLLSAGQLHISGELLPIAYRYIQDQVTFELTDGAVDLQLDYSVEALPDGSIDIETHNMMFNIINTRLVDKASGDQLLLLPALRVEQGSMQLPEQVAHIKVVAIDDFRIDAAIDENGILNLANLMVEDEPAAGPNTDATADAGTNIQTEDEVSADTVAEAADDPLAGWAVSLDEFQINRFSAGFTDQSINNPASLGIDSLDVSVRSISNTPGAAFPFTSNIAVSGGGTITENGSLTVLPDLRVSSTLEVSGLPLNTFQNYLNEFLQLRIDSGEFNLKANINSSPDELLDFRGTLSIDNLDTQDTLKNVSLLDWKQLLIDDLAFRLDGNRLEISKVTLTQPYVRFEIAEDLSTNVGDLLVEDTSAASEPTTTADNNDSLPMEIQIGEIDIRNGSANFADFSLPLPFAAEIAKLDGDLSTVSTTSAQPTKVDVKGVVDQYGTASIDGELNVLDPLNLMDIQVAFRNLNMPTLSPYTVAFVGQKIEAGKLNVDLGYKFVDGLMEGSNSIIIDDFTLGEKVPHDEAMNLPLGLAVALLKDKDGIIDLDLKVSGDVNDPEFSVAGLVLKALANVLTKVVTSPFRALGGLVGGDDIDLDLLQFEAGDAALTPPDTEKLIKLAEALSQRPELMLVIPPVLQTERDTRAMQEAATQVLIDAQMSDRESDSPDMFVRRQRKVLETLYKQWVPEGDLSALKDASKRAPEPDARPVLDEVEYSEKLRLAVVAKQVVSADQLEILAQNRAAAVQTQLISTAPDLKNRISIAETESDKNDDPDWIIMKLQMEATQDATATGEESP